MKQLLAGIFMAVLMTWIGSVAYAIHQDIPSETQIPEPGADAAKLYQYIDKYNPYGDWNLWPGKKKLYKGTEPHGSLLTTYVNKTAYSSIRGKKGMADGSMIVKENYTADKKLAALTVMYKVKGYNPAAGDWFWVKYNPSGKVEASGKVEGCITCHGKKKDNDYVMTEAIK